MTIWQIRHDEDSPIRSMARVLSDDQRALVQEFLRRPAPPGHTPYWHEWHRLCVELPDGCEVVLLEALVEGTEEEQYAAVLALRAHAIGVVGVGYGAEFHYLVEEPGTGEKRVVRPRVPRTLP